MTQTATYSTTQQGAAAYAPVVGRVLIALLFLASAYGKIAAPAGTIGYIAAHGLPVPAVSYGVALVVELFGGLALVAGYRTRFVALVLAIFSIAAALGFHNDFADQNQQIHFLKNLAISGGLLQIVAFGAGAFSLDRSAGRA